MNATDRYSRFVLMAKIFLPVTALAILSVLFFVAETLDPNAAIPYAKVDVERALREQGISNPSFGGTAENGTNIALSAESIRPVQGDANSFQGSDLLAVLSFPEQGQINLLGALGVVQPATGAVSLGDGVRIESTNGYVIETQGVQTSLFDGHLASAGQVRATGPLGALTAGQLDLRQHTENDSFLLVFSQGVRLVYEGND